jgi:hypothetical protein
MRVMQQAAGEAKDPRLGTEIGRLCAAGRMTATEATAAFRVAEIYGRYERMAGLKRSCRSPSYEVGYGGGGDTIEGDRDLQVGAAWHQLQGHIPIWPPDLRSHLEELAVENKCIGPMELHEVRMLLGTLAEFFGITSARDNSPLARRSPRPPAHGKALPATKLPRSEIDREALRLTLLRVNPNLLPDEIDRETTFFFTLKERERFRREKADRNRKAS